MKDFISVALGDDSPADPAPANERNASVKTSPAKGRQPVYAPRAHPATDEGGATSDDASDAPPETDDATPGFRSAGGSWTIPMLCAGIALIAACVLIPLADENRQMVYEREKLRLDLEQIHQQVAVNDEFLQKLGSDPTLAERLAQRQMKTIREGSAVVELGGVQSKPEMSPFLLVSLPPPPPMPAYHPVGGRLAMLCLTGKSRLFLVGCGLMLCAAGLVLGGTRKEKDD